MAIALSTVRQSPATHLRLGGQPLAVALSQQHPWNTRLDESPDYVALSYVWGKRSPDDPVLRLDGRPLQIGTSLWQALEELTTHVGTMRLWVDQICIDQNNKTDREQQVQLMSRIYAQAQHVIGWLGSHGDDSHLAFDLLLVLGHMPEAHEVQSDSGWQRAADALMQDEHLYKVEDLFNLKRRPVQAVACLA
ncbi:hypothetical protein EK21DRAFT_94916 [Setomelanomma holmii]|uniref:Heterokaryon incompatibility domain-containing protein n=1 Tax=Setomelanomma holmii TaxID=210430 RepID=A0A9P4LGD5_9PLEO|nr:hypothetical protein EK21DRAFT_94916 [Setomelanomma holmii]